MRLSTKADLNVLTPQLSLHLRTFNSAARDLQSLGIRLHCIDSTRNCLSISPQDGQALEAKGLVTDLASRSSAGSTRWTAQFQGVAVTWTEPISYLDFTSSTDRTFH